MSPTAKGERRRKSRKRPPSLIYVELAAGNGGMMRDLSGEGFALRAMMPLRAGEKTPFSFLLNETVQIAGEGEILWVEENGRVAGVRFTEVSAEARERIQDWLNGSLQSRKGREATEKIVAAPPSTLDQLREDIRSTTVSEKPAQAVRAEAPLPVVEAVSSPPEVTPTTSPPEVTSSVSPAQTAPPIAHVAASTAPPNVLVPEVIAEAPPIPLAPPVSPATSFIDPLPEPLPAGPGLPDISEILIQPRGRKARYMPSPREVEPLPELGRAPETPRASWMDWFTLSRAIAIMIVLAVVVAISAYHRSVGQGLIWLGEAMGGGQVSQAQLAVSNDARSTSSPSRSSSNLPDSSTHEETPGEAAGPSGANGMSAPAMGSDSQGSFSTGARSTHPPVSPLSGISDLASSDSNQETGQAEYLHAVQLLHAKNSGADPSEAVRLLWISVEKGNPSAEVTLAAMYWHGRGVARNCDQTRILLSAAARKGSAEAQKLLQQFQWEGCE